VTTRKRSKATPKTTQPPVPSTVRARSARDEDFAGPPFFLSYARAKAPARAPEPRGDVNEGVERLFMDLSNRVAQLLPLPAGLDAGFVDLKLEAGTRWSLELLRTVGTCGVFVALLSDPYLHRSEWCAMEWDLFSRRKVRRIRTTGRDFGSPILPVLWTPLERPVPDLVAAVQRFSPLGVPPEFREMYASEGVLGLSDVYAQAYTAIVWKIARQIQITYNSFTVDPIARTTTTGLRRSFQQGGTP
jgi:TIR domain